MGHSSCWLSFRPFLWLFTIWSLVGMACAQQSTLARHFQHSAASLWGDCDFESGETLGMPAYETCCSHNPSTGVRLGEAGNPGPLEHEEEVFFGTTNPSGLRTKEALAVQLGPGVWSLAETQLSSVTQASTKKAINFHAYQASRKIHSYFGAPVPLRSRSDWAGGWGGVAALSDWSTSHYALNWPDGFWESSRILITQHLIGSYPVLVCSFNGYPKGVTYPNARALTDRLLGFITQQIILGYSGLAIVQGDFNHGKNELQQTQLWQELGWRSSQDIAASRWNHEVTPTCKGSTERDFIWVSPALQPFMSSLEVFDTFMEHSTLRAGFRLPMIQVTTLAWPLPSKIPWEEVDTEAWHNSEVTCPINQNMDSTSYFRNFFSAWEDSLSGHFHSDFQSQLEKPQRGRGQRTAPSSGTVAPPRCRASTPGEVALASNAAGEAVLLWFRQLRRLQSYLHSIKKGQVTITATTYRLELWSAIRRAPGFKDSFPSWWGQQDFAAEVGPLPQDAPSLLLAADIFHHFHLTFRRFEDWHQRWRTKQLQVKFEQGMDALFRSLRDPPRDSARAFTFRYKFEVVDVDNTGTLITLDKDPPAMQSFGWFRNNMMKLDILSNEGPTLQAEEPLWIFPGDTLELRHYAATIAEVHSHLCELWRPRWQTMETITDEQWQRISNFVDAFMPPRQMEMKPLGLEHWQHSISRFKKKAARGPDGYAKEDLVKMHPQFQKGLVDFLNSIEEGHSVWPKQWQEGHVLTLAKSVPAELPSQFRPIAVFSVIYRAWSSHRSREVLAWLANFVHEDAHGFLPRREAMQTWVQIQASAELALRGHETLTGMATDLKRAFNNIRRKPIFYAAEHLGLPDRITLPWRSFLTSLTRRFKVGNALSTDLSSNCGFAEGDPFSVVAMVILDWMVHVHLSFMAPRVRLFSFVDNLSLLSKAADCLSMAFFALVSFLDLFGLSMDPEKSYSWGSLPHARRDIAPLGFKIVDTIGELGGTLNLSLSSRVQAFFTRSRDLGPKWVRLRYSQAPQSQKLLAIPGAFWSSASWSPCLKLQRSDLLSRTFILIGYIRQPLTGQPMWAWTR